MWDEIQEELRPKHLLAAVENKPERLTEALREVLEEPQWAEATIAAPNQMAWRNDLVTNTAIGMPMVAQQATLGGTNA